MAKIATNVSVAMLLPSLIQVTKSISGSVVPLAMFLQVTRRNYNNTIKGMTHKKSYIYIQRSSLQDNFMRPHGQSDDRERDIFSSQADKYTY